MKTSQDKLSFSTPCIPQVAILLVAVLVGLLALCRMAYAQMSEIILLATDYHIESFDGIAYTKDGLFVNSPNGIFMWDEKAARLEMLKSASNDQTAPAYSRIISCNDTLYALSADCKALHKLTVSENMLSSELITSFGIHGINKDENTLPPELYAVFIFEDDLYLLIDKPALDNLSMRQLYRINLSDGHSKAIYTNNEMVDVIGFKEGQLLMLLNEPNAGTTRLTKNAQQLLVFDIATEQLGKAVLDLPYAQAGGFAYDNQTDTIYYIEGDGLFMMKSSAKPLKLTSVPTLYQNDLSAQIVDNVFYAASDHSRLLMTGLMPAAKEKETLLIAGDFTEGTLGQGYWQFMSQNPTVSVTLNPFEPFAKAERYLQDYLVDTFADIYVVGNLRIAQALINKGYALDLSKDDALSASLQSMYPQIIKPFMKDGVPYAVPINVQSSELLAYSPPVLHALGLTPDALPQTFDELFSFIQAWYADDALYDSGYELFSDNIDSPRDMLAKRMIQQQINACINTDIDITLDTPEMRTLLMKLDDMATQPVMANRQGKADVSYIEPAMQAQSTTALFDIGLYLLPQSNYKTHDYVPLSIGFSASESQFVTLDCTVLIINPRSKNSNAAFAFINTILSYMNDYSTICLYPNRNEPVEDPDYNDNIVNQRRQIDEIEKNMALAMEETEKTEYQERLIRHNDAIDRLEKNRYYYSAQDILQYRQFANNVVPAYAAYQLLFDTENLSSLYQRYFQFQISGEQFLAECEKVLLMIRLENQ